MSDTFDVSPETLSAIFILAGTAFTAILIWLGSRSKNQGDAIKVTTDSVIALTAQVSALIASQATLERKITTLEDQKADLEREVAALKDRNTELLAKIDELEKSKYALADKVADMQKELEIKDQVIVNLQAQIDHLTIQQSAESGSHA